ncbi:MAG: TlpA family protein disulfide reductase [Solirubrobacteraceae bacterium]
MLVTGCAVLALSGCGSQTRNAAPSAGTVAMAFRASPAPLAALHAQASRLLGGGSAAFKARLAALRGYPVVVNSWGAWCPSCRREFPSFQRAAVAYGRQVAFVGLDGKDSGPSAASFLRRFPVTYPSYVDPKARIAQVIQAVTFYPQTVYINRRGKIVYDHLGPYLSPAALEQDIRRYLLAS